MHEKIAKKDHERSTLLFSEINLLTKISINKIITVVKIKLAAIILNPFFLLYVVYKIMQKMEKKTTVVIESPTGKNHFSLLGTTCANEKRKRDKFAKSANASEIECLYKVIIIKIRPHADKREKTGRTDHVISLFTIKSAVILIAPGIKQNIVIKKIIVPL